MEREPGIPIFVAGAVISQTADNLLVADGGDPIRGCRIGDLVGQDLHFHGVRPVLINLVWGVFSGVKRQIVIVGDAANLLI